MSVALPCLASTCSTSSATRAKPTLYSHSHRWRHYSYAVLTTCLNVLICLSSFCSARPRRRAKSTVQLLYQIDKIHLDTDPSTSCLQIVTQRTDQQTDRTTENRLNNQPTERKNNRQIATSQEIDRRNGQKNDRPSHCPTDQRQINRSTDHALPVRSSIKAGGLVKTFLEPSTLSFSMMLVSMTIWDTPSCHTILHRSSTVFSTGPAEWQSAE